MIAERIANRLDALGSNPARAALEAGFGIDFVRDIIRGKVAEPSAKRLFALARVLDCTPAYLLGESDEVGVSEPPAVEQQDTPSARLKEARVRAGYRSAAEAARALGVPVPTYCGYENGERGLKPKTANTIAAGLGVDPAWLLYGGQTAGPASAPRAAQPISLTIDRNGSARLVVDVTIPAATAMQIMALLQEGDG